MDDLKNRRTDKEAELPREELRACLDMLAHLGGHMADDTPSSVILDLQSSFQALAEPLNPLVLTLLSTIVGHACSIGKAEELKRYFDALIKVSEVLSPEPRNG